MIKLIEKEVDSANQETWKAAARLWRLPYWDWAEHQRYLGNYGLPQICTVEKIRIVPFSSDLQNPQPTAEVDNPHLKFTNPTGKAFGDQQSMGEFRIEAELVSDPPAVADYI